MRRHRAVAAILVWLLGLSQLAFAQRAVPFPHDKHAKLFPTCTSCHSGITTGVSARVFPNPATCTACHNDRDAALVNWAPPAPKATNLKFSHTVHVAKSTAAAAPAACTSCHAAQADTTWMHVQGAKAAGCVTCHAHVAPEHLAPTAVCKTCHNPLAESRALTAAQISAFPKPATHNRADFASKHAPATSSDVATCATCHARESCARCHANASQTSSIVQLAPDARVAELMRGRAATYATPASHLESRFALGHGALAKTSVKSCANCHTQTTCKSCHTGSNAASVIAGLPVTGSGTATGVVLTTPRVHPTDFLSGHKSAAASGRLDCAGCHQERECSSCHEGSSSRRYHASDFVDRHAAAAFSQEQTCTSCHRTETFCRSCHLKSNVTAPGTKTGAAHTGQPMWLLQHGEAARRGLTGCTSCHQQRDCLRCHSDLGLKVNPHGAGFDASALSARNKQMCATCHLRDPLAR